MLGQYSKVAILKDINTNFVKYTNSDMPEVNAKVEINLSNIDFKPKNYIFDFESRWRYLDSEIYLYGDGNFLTKDEIKMSHNGFVVNIKKENIRYNKGMKKLEVYGGCNLSDEYRNSVSIKVLNLVLLG